MHLTPDFAADPKTARERVLGRWREAFGDKDGGFRALPRGRLRALQPGLLGRVGLHELMLGSDAIKRQIQSRGRVDQILGQALAEACARCARTASRRCSPASPT